MKVSVDSKKFSEAIRVASYIVGKKGSLPVLSCILLDARNNTLTVKSTNLESGIEILLPAKVVKDGVCALPALILSHTIQSAVADTVQIEYKEKNVQITSGVNVTVIHTTPHNEFPVIPVPEKKSHFSVSRTVFISGIRSVAYSASKSTIRQEFASIFITYKNNFLTFIATDSFRLSEKKIPISIKKQPEDILIPVKNALDSIYILEHVSDEDIFCTVADSQIHIQAGNISFVSRIIDATFPDYESIIPKNTTTEVIVLKEDLASVLKKATIFSGESQQVGFHVYPKKKKCTIAAQHTTTGEMSDSIDAALKGEDIDIHFNIPFITDCFQSISADSVVLKFTGPNKPLVIEGISDKTFRYLVMPLNR